MPTCGAEELPQVDFDFCNPETGLSEIRRIFIGRISGGGFEDWTNPVEWAQRISEDSMCADAIRAMYVIGDKPIPASLRALISMDRKKTISKEHTVNATIDEVNDTNHAFVTEMKGKYYRLWYETAGGYMFGGNDGIIASIDADMVLARGLGEIMVYLLTATWKNLRTEDRIASPIFADVVIAIPPCEQIAISERGGTATTWLVKWTLPEGVTWLQYAVTETPDEPTEWTEIDGTPETMTLTGLDPETTYYFWMRQYCGHCTYSEPAFISFTTDEAPACAVVENIVLDSFTDSELTYSWDVATPNDFEYSLELSPSPPVGAGTLISTNTITFTGLDPENTYYLYIRHLCGGGSRSAWRALAGTTDAVFPVLPVTNGLVGFYIGQYGVERSEPGGEITRWRDLSGLNNHLEPQFGTAYYQANAWNSKAIVRFDGSGHYLRNGFAGVFGNKATVFFVSQVTTGEMPYMGTVCEYATTDFNVETGGFKLSIEGNLGQFQIDDRGDVGAAYATGTTFIDEMIIHMGILDKGVPYLDELAPWYFQAMGSGYTGGFGADNTNNFAADNFAVGRGVNGSNPFVGHLGTVIVYNRRLSIGEFSDVVDWLKANYGF